MNSMASDIYHTQVEKGVAVAWVNSYSAVVVKTSGATLLFDPVGMEIPGDAPLDLIAITHGHSDHWEPALVADIRSRTGSTVAAPPFLAAKICGLGGGTSPTRPSKRRSSLPGAGQSQEVISLLPGDEIVVGRTTVSALRCDHAAVEPLAFQVRSPDGITVYLPGDTTPFPEMAHLPLSVPGAISGSIPEGKPQSEDNGVDLLCWMGTALTDGAEIANLVQPKIFLSYSITPPAAGKRAYEILTGSTAGIPFHALERHQVFVWPGE